uniref:protein aurora borealis-like n=1 Tax=Ciona intestinalis TaxID=7719 RepID=UPI0005215773|nr:protein aurora borealis-like [Ciona intestinalis]|eukprot:XP_009859289.1 protein aurora borealis-like [Ciona intestinalis]
MSSINLTAEENAKLKNEKTPKCKKIGTKPVEHESHLTAAQFSTPKSSINCSDTSVCTVNESIIPNPFENPSIIDSLLQPSCSPSMNFSTSHHSRNISNKSPGSFWTIDQIAVLKPTEIDLSKLHEQENFVKLDPASEMKAQRAIDDFFASTINITSPFSLSDKPHCVAIISPSPSLKRNPQSIKRSENSAAKRIPSKIMEEATEFPSETKSKNQVTTSTQTTLTIPSNVDIEKLLSQFYTYSDSANDSQSESLCNSSLRRKLFFQDVLEDEDSFHDSCGTTSALPDLQEEISKTPKSKIKSITTPSTCQSHFSSSPVVGGRMFDLGSPDCRPNSNSRGRKLLLGSPSPLLGQYEDSMDTYKSCCDTSPQLHNLDADLDITPLKDSPSHNIPQHSNKFVFPNNNEATDKPQFLPHKISLCLTSELSPIKLPEPKTTVS